MPGLGELLFGHGDKFKQLPTMNQGQQGLFDMLSRYLQGYQGGGGERGVPQGIGQTQPFQQGQQYLQNLYGQSPEAFDRLKQPYMNQFNQEIVPGIAERFSGMGSGSWGSSGLNQALGQAGANLSAALGSQFENQRAQMFPQLQQYGQAPMDQYRQLLSQILGQNTFENTYQPGNTGFFGGALQGLGQGLGGALGQKSGSFF
jgi:hypothetical protein